MKNLKNIISNETTINVFEPIPKYNRFNIKTHVFCVNELPDNYILEKEYELFSHNDRHSFFFSNRRNIVDFCTNINSWDTGLFYNEFLTISKENLGVVGNRICVYNNELDSIEVYKVIGFNNFDGKSNYYFNVK